MRIEVEHPNLNLPVNTNDAIVLRPAQGGRAPVRRVRYVTVDAGPQLQASSVWKEKSMSAEPEER